MAESRRLQDRVAELAAKAPPAREDESVPTPIPGREPGGFLDVRFRVVGEEMVFAGVFDAAGQVYEELAWFPAEDADGRPCRMLRVPFVPGGQVSTPVAERRSHRKDTVAAKKAAQLEFPRQDQQRLRAVLAAFQQDFRDENRGITDEELASRMGLERGQVGPRRLDLVNTGWLAPRGKRQGKTGAENTVYVLTDGAIKKMGMRRSDG